MMQRILPVFGLASALAACGDSSPTAADATVDNATDARADAVTSDMPSGGNGRARVTVNYMGAVTPGSQLQLAASREMVLAGFPAAFAVVDMPTFPATSTISFGMPGTYYLSVNLNAPPVSFGPPGPEDRVAVTAMPVTIRAGETTDVTLDILDRDR